MLNRTLDAITARARELSISVNFERKPWTAEQDEVVRQSSGKKTISEVAAILNRTEDAVRDRVTLLDVPYTKANKVCEVCKTEFVGCIQHPNLCEDCKHDRAVIYSTITGHHRLIVRRHPNYVGMPFYEGWNPQKGLIQVGIDWIVANLGYRPDGTSMHIIDHAKGFVPGNLEWTHPKKQTNQQMYKIIAQQRHHIKKLEERVRELEQHVVLPQAA
jgi:hypothetical protein